MSSKILYANGCSMVEGCELGNKQFNYDEAKLGPLTSKSKFYNLSKEHLHHMSINNWSYKLKELLGFDAYMNSARPGSCGKRIVRTSILDILKLLQTYKPEDIFVVIGWTRINRFEFLDPSGIEYQFAPGTRVRSRSLIHKKILDMADIYEVYIAQNFRQNQLNHFMHVLEMQNFLKCMNINYMFSYSTYENLINNYDATEISNTLKDDTLKTLYKQIDNSNLILNEFNSDISYEDRVQNILKGSFEYFAFSNKYPIGLGQHPLEEAHSDWAAFLYNQIKSKEIL